MPDLDKSMPRSINEAVVNQDHHTLVVFPYDFLADTDSTLIDWFFLTSTCSLANVCDFIMAQSLQVGISMVQTDLSILGSQMT